MDNAVIIQQILQQVKVAKAKGTESSTVYANQDHHHQKHEFLFFVKPEIILSDKEENIQAVLELLLRKISQFDFIIREIRLLGASYLEKYDIIAQHYGVINALSREPLKVFTSEAKNKFREIYGYAPEDVKVLGSLQFLQQYDAFTPDSLQQLWQQSQTAKLSGGNYCARVKAGGEDIYLINGFHPKQLIHFTAEGRMIIPFKLTGNLDWVVARNQFIGKTNPADAAPGSLRNELLVNREKFGLNEVSASQNGFHLSAGPVEGLVELMRYGSDFSAGKIKKPSDFSFGRQLLETFSEEVTDIICSNRIVNYKGNRISTFDLTEEKNSREAIDLLKNCDMRNL
jgi:hypothetical protein